MEKVITDNQHYADIAKAIRTKNETDTLYKPSEMAPAILAIQGGVELNFEVAGGTTQPESPKENTIWVNTPNEITGWEVRTIAPDATTDGMVWFETAISGYTEISVIADPAVYINPSRCHQYVSGAWVDKEAMTYKNGAWNKKMRKK